MSHDRARQLRKSMTSPELRLWNALRLRPEGFKFRRQHPVGPYVLDFYCSAAALAIEVDGMAHDMGCNPDRDIRRDAYLAEQGIAAIRIRAADVRDNLEEIVSMIVARCRERSAQ